MPQSHGSPSGVGRSALLEAMQATSNDAIITIDERGIMQSFNPAAERLFGYRQDEVVGTNVKMLMPGHFRDQHDRYIANYLETGVKRIIGIGRVVVGEKKDGSTFPMELAVGESRIDDRSIFVGFIRDLTQIRKEQRRVQELQHELFHVSRLGEMGQVVSSLAHEVNQPLAAIMNYLHVAQQMVENLPENGAKPVAGVLSKVEAQTRRAADIVKRLRAFIERREVERKHENIATLIEESLALGVVSHASGGPRVRLTIAPGIPEVVVDRVQIQQVIVNLVRNAMDAMTDAPRRELTIAAGIEDGAGVRVAVSDTGPGISPEVADRLFAAFVTTKPEGMGVGLSICRAIVEGHGGSISFGPNADGGATFAFTLPFEPGSGG